MAYLPTLWKDRAVEKPRTNTSQNNPDGTVTLIPAPGAIVEVGTPVNATNLNKLEQGLKTHEADKAAHGLDKVSARIDNTEYNIYQIILQNYYENKDTVRRGLFFDGFLDTKIIDVENSATDILDTDLRKLYFKEPIPQIIQSPSNPYSLFGMIGYNSVSAILAQTFRVIDYEKITNVTINIKKSGAPIDGLIVSIYNTNVNGLPFELIQQSQEIKPSSMSSSFSDITFNFSDLIIPPGKYAVVVSRTGSNSSSNYYMWSSYSTSTYGEWEDNKSFNKSSATWTNQSSVYNVKISIVNARLERTYQTIEQQFSQSVNKVVLYVKSKVVEGCSVSAKIALYNETEEFLHMTLESTEYFDDGYKEDRFVFISQFLANKIKLKLILAKSDVLTSYEVSQYGCILGVV